MIAINANDSSVQRIDYNSVFLVREIVYPLLNLQSRVCRTRTRSRELGEGTKSLAFYLYCQHILSTHIVNMSLYRYVTTSTDTQSHCRLCSSKCVLSVELALALRRTFLPELHLSTSSARLVVRKGCFMNAIFPEGCLLG